MTRALRKEASGPASGRKGDCAGTTRFGPTSSRRCRQSQSPRKVALARIETSNAAASLPHPAPRIVTIASRPSVVGRDG